MDGGFSAISSDRGQSLAERHTDPVVMNRDGALFL
jgi:hypothetical protein